MVLLPVFRNINHVKDLKKGDDQLVGDRNKLTVDVLLPALVSAVASQHQGVEHEEQQWHGRLLLADRCSRVVRKANLSKQLKRVEQDILGVSLLRSLILAIKGYIAVLWDPTKFWVMRWGSKGVLIGRCTLMHQASFAFCLWCRNSYGDSWTGH